jgi:hypothetical protein
MYVFASRTQYTERIMRLPWKFLLMMMFAIWGVGLAMTVNGPDKGGTNFEEGELQTSKCMVIEMSETCENINREKNFPLSLISG